jgi:hypothetical protein
MDAVDDMDPGDERGVGAVFPLIFETATRRRKKSGRA